MKMVRSKARADIEAHIRMDKAKTQGITKERDKEDERRRSVIGKRTVWPEKGIDLEELRPTFVPSVVQDWGWERVAYQSLPYNESIVREFYTMLVEYEFRHTGRVVVKGVEVIITAQRINAFYGLPDFAWSTGIPRPNDSSDLSTLARELRKSGRAGWDAKEDPVKHGELKLEAAFWNKFASHSIRPTRHLYTVPRKKMPLVFCLMERRQIDLGQVIFLEIKDASAAHPDGMPVLPFPGLISHFCQEAGIDVFDNPRQVSPGSPPIDAISFNRLLKNHPEVPKLPTGRQRGQLQAEEDAHRGEFAEEGPSEVEHQQPQLPPHDDPVQPPHYAEFMPSHGNQLFNQASSSYVPPRNDNMEELMRAILEGQVKLGEQLTDMKNAQTELLNRMVALETQSVQNQTQIDNQLREIRGKVYNYYQRRPQRQEEEHRQRQEEENRRRQGEEER